MQFWTKHTLSFKMIYDATCYPSGMGTCHFLWPLLQHYTLLLHFVILFKLICNMTMFWKSWILTYKPHPRVEAVCGQSICYLEAAFVILFNLICCMTIFWKKMTLDLSDPIPITWCPKISAWCINMKHYTDDHHGDYIFVVSSLNLYYV